MAALGHNRPVCLQARNDPLGSTPAVRSQTSERLLFGSYTTLLNAWR